MKSIEYTTVDKSKWGIGEWTNEPDKVQWEDEITKLPCLIVRNPWGGHLCGYVGVSQYHPWFGKKYNSVDDEIEVHGGLTFSDRCDPRETPERGICHTVEPGEDGNVWWLGFNCSHSEDLSPAYAGYNWHWHCTYKNVEFVKQQCQLLAKQLVELHNEN